MNAPSCQDREQSESKRNARDLRKIQRLQALVDDWICDLAFIEPLEHPDCRWHPDDLRNSLFAAERDLKAEAKRVTEAILTPDPVDIAAAIREPII